MRVTIVVTYSKREYRDLVLENLNNLDLGDNDCDLLIMDDAIRTEPWDIPRFGNKQVVSVGEGRPVTKSIPGVRSRIAEVRNKSRGYIKGDMVFSFEDDTEVPKNALVKLLDDWHSKGIQEQFRKPGLISGIQVGRHSRRIIGAWSVDDYQFPSEGYTFHPKDIVTPLAEIDGAGFYCYLTTADLYKSSRYGWQEPFGPDVWYGLLLKTKGYANYLDQSIICPHRSGNVRYVPDEDTIKLKVYQNRLGQWINEPVRVE